VIRGDRPIYRFFLIWKDSQGSTREVPARCLLDWGSTSFAISKRFVSALNIPTIERAQAIPSYDASGRRFTDDGKLRTAPLRFAFGNHCSDDVTVPYHQNYRGWKGDVRKRRYQKMDVGGDASV
jgi:hypothetical protein